jgi:transposase
LSAKWLQYARLIDEAWGRRRLAAIERPEPEFDGNRRHELDFVRGETMARARERGGECYPVHESMLLPRRRVVERSFAWMRRFRRLAKDYGRLPGTVAGLHFFAFVWLMLARVVKLFAESA